jgi:Fur family ferric uptake transcriptional regulator
VRLRGKHKKISRATIYRTLELMVDSGIVGRLRIGEAGYRYERLRAGDHHDHLICDQCGRVIEFFEARIEQLQDEVAERHGFVLLSHTHQMRGICRSCRPRRPKSSAGSSGEERLGGGALPFTSRPRG